MAEGTNLQRSHRCSLRGLPEHCCWRTGHTRSRACGFPEVLVGSERLEGRGLRQGLEVLVQPRQQPLILLTLLLLLRLSSRREGLGREEKGGEEAGGHTRVRERRHTVGTPGVVSEWLPAGSASSENASEARGYRRGSSRGLPGQFPWGQSLACISELALGRLFSSVNRKLHEVQRKKLLQ